MATVAEIIEDLQKNYNSEDHIACDIWTANDIEIRAINDDIELTDEQIDEVIDNVHKDIDAGDGINWDVVSAAIGSVGGC